MIHIFPYSLHEGRLIFFTEQKDPSAPLVYGVADLKYLGKDISISIYKYDGTEEE